MGRWPGSQSKAQYNEPLAIPLHVAAFTSNCPVLVTAREENCRPLHGNRIGNESARIGGDVELWTGMDGWGNSTRIIMHTMSTLIMFGLNTIPGRWNLVVEHLLGYSTKSNPISAISLS